jgi:hypothetical protein
MNKKARTKPLKPRAGPLPAILGKGGPMRDDTKYTRKMKHKKG